MSLQVRATIVAGQAVTHGNESVCLGNSKRAVRSYIGERRVYVIVRSLLNVSYLFDVYVRNYIK